MMEMERSTVKVHSPAETCSYSHSYCLDVFKVAAVLLEVDRPLVEEPLEGHVQRGVVRGLAAQHHALAHGHLHSGWAQLHAHGLWKHKAAALSPQANPESDAQPTAAKDGSRLAPACRRRDARFALLECMIRECVIPGFTVKQAQ